MTTMHWACRAFGHKAAHDFIMRDAHSFAQQSWCKRCGVPLQRVAGQRWQVLDPSDVEPLHIATTLPAKQPDPVRPHSTPDYVSAESRAAYRRAARELYDSLHGRTAGTESPAFAEWFAQLDAWQGGAPPLAPHASALQPTPQPFEPASRREPPSQPSVAAAAPSATVAEVIVRLRLEIAAAPVAVEPQRQNAPDVPGAENHAAARPGPDSNEVLHRLHLVEQQKGAFPDRKVD